MKSSKIDSQNSEVKKDQYILTGLEIKEVQQRKADFLNGKNTSRPWKEIKKDYNLI
jgi:hypothetical protein